MSIFIFSKGKFKLEDQENFDFSKEIVNNNYFFQFISKGRKGLISKTKNSFTFLSERPVLKDIENQNFYFSETIDYLSEDLLTKFENELMVFHFRNCENNELRLLISSGRLSRMRFYYTIIRGKAILFSDDLRELIPYSACKVSHEILYGILKFSTTPEYDTVLKDIFAIPASSFLQLDAQNLLKIILSGKVTKELFLPYFQLNYSYTGGNISETEKILERIMAFEAKSKPDILLSGGIDSTLINLFYDRNTHETYDAHYIYFGEKDSEINWVQRSIQGTKARLNIWEMRDLDFIPSFDVAVKKMIYPTIDAIGSVIPGAYFSMAINDSQLSGLIDGTGADSCYGSRDYNLSLPLGKTKGGFELFMQEQVNYFFKLNLFSGYDRISPRDRFVSNPYLQYIGGEATPFLNKWCDKSKDFSSQLDFKFSEWQKNWPLISDNDDYANYTILNFFFYATKLTTVKFFDMMPGTNIIYPFMYKNVLEDQGKYTWQQKSENGIVKYPLKKILEKYYPEDFVYRKKVGLNNPIYHWLDNKDYRAYFLDIVNQKEGIALNFFGKNNLNKFNKPFAKENIYPGLKVLLMNLAAIQSWINYHKLSL